MDQTLGAAAPATVITLRLWARTQGRPLQAATCQNFANLIGNSLRQGCHIQPTVRNDAEMSLALIVPVTSQALTILRRLLAVQAELHRMRADARMSFPGPSRDRLSERRQLHRIGASPGPRQACPAA